MREPIDTFTINGLALHIGYDSDPMPPRTEWDNASSFVCWHRRYTLGDAHDFQLPADFNAWWTDGNGKNGLLMPLYLYHHSGITISTNPFGCPWDSGQVGWAYMTAETLTQEFPGLTYDEQKAKGRDLIAAEVETYDKYLRGDVYRFEVLDEDEDYLDGCGGYYGKEAVRDAATEAATALAQQRGVQLTLPALEGAAEGLIHG